ncbi:glycosyltransferase [Parasedimentitalea maritima]|uniref:Glycosyltransferase n=1 Tax=Parasedimentitalea maritima TaxID=2578117 RepID=A0A6A4RC53_9RHOB|nr:glycosyltransferase [Zongyanglinia marina]KAE9630980.1 glycosyltransferase [Zongyanglinia marina]
MANRYKYTCLLLAYEQEPYVEEAVRSALEQDCEPMQIILSDDASRDGTFARMKEVVEQYEGPHKVLLNRNNTNLGVNAHLKNCLEMCDGNVIIAAAGDDIYYSDRAQRIMEAFEETDPLLVYSHADVANLDGSPAEALYKKATFYSTVDPLAAAKSCSLYLGATCAWHRDLYQKYGPIQFENAHEDLILGFRAALEGRLHFIDAPLLTYRMGAGLTNTPTGTHSKEFFQKRRLHHISHDTCVFKQRLIDTQTFGMHPDHEISRCLALRASEGEIREAFITQGFRGIVPYLRRHLLRAIGITISESRRRRKILRQKA